MAGQQPSFFEPTADEAIEAARSLYDDELKPFGRILLKRIRERAAAAPSEGSAARFADADSVPLIDPKFLRKLCEECPSFAVEPAEGREYAVTLLDRPAVFVDATSHVDPYPMHMWVEAAAYFESLEGEESRLPCGRYACAQVLRERGVAFLLGRSLGELCHIIQLAISQRKLLGYLEGHTVPYCLSEECAKQRCAIRQLPFGEAQAALPAEPFATWEDMRAGLRLILESSCNPAPGVITLSNVKRLFRSQLGLEVSETVLGHSRVCELLQDPRLHDICSVQVFACGQALVSLVEQPQLPSCSTSAFPLWTAAPPAAGFPAAAPTSMSPSCSSSSSCASTRSVGLCAAAGAPPLATMPLPLSAWAAAVQVPLVEGKHAPHWDATTTASYAESETDAGWTSGASDDLETCSSSSPRDCGELAECDEEALPAAFAFAGFVVRNTFIDESPRASASKRSRSLPRSLRVQ